MKKLSFRIESGGLESTITGDFTVRIDPSGIVQVVLTSIRLWEGDVLREVERVHGLVRGEVVRKLSADMDAFRYTDTLTVYMNVLPDEKEEVINETEN